MKTSSMSVMWIMLGRPLRSVVIGLQSLVTLVFLLMIVASALAQVLYERVVLQRCMDWRATLQMIREGLRTKVMSVYEIAASQGYVIEDHKVVTDDGFVLTLQKLIPKHRHVQLKSKGSVILQHGLYQTSMLYLMNKPEDGLAYILADQGYEVYLGNNRGNLHSRAHENWRPCDAKFWEWSVDDLSHDVRANIEYVRSKQTSRKPLYYVGHSQGGAQGLATFSLHPELQGKVDLFVALAPGAFVNKMPSRPLRFIACMASRYPNVYYAMFGTQAFLPLMEKARMIVPPAVFNYLAYLMFHKLFQWSDTNWDKSRNWLFFSETPGGTSSQTIAHWMQQSTTGKFQRFCYNSEKANFDRYKLKRAPEYPLHELAMPIAVIYGGRDGLIDFKKLISKLPNCVHAQAIKHHEHMDSLIAQDAKDLVFPTIISLFKAYGKSTIAQQNSNKHLKACRSQYDINVKSSRNTTLVST